MPSIQEQKLIAAAARRLEVLKLRDAFDAIDLDSRPTPPQQTILNDIGKVQFRYAIAGNQTGKSQIGAKETSWILQENHPFWKRPARWGREPLLIIVAARTHSQIEKSLWPKIKGFLDASEIKEERIGQQLKTVTHIPTGNSILFMSHHSDREAREKMQGFVAHYVWIDEMPGSVDLIEELHRRVQSRAGYFLATFTPKVRNDRIRKLVDSVKEPFAKRYRLSMFDNPILTDRDKAAILDSLSSHSEAYRNTILYGDWSGGEDSVYDYRPDEHCSELPASYSRGWRHAVSVDPAQVSKVGLTLWGEDPATGMWYAIKTKYLLGSFAPSELIPLVEKEVEGYNVVRRIYDPHETWFMREAARLGLTYLGVYNKSQRKDELIINLQQALTSGIIKLTSWCQDLADELIECSRDDNGKIINSSRFHLLDSAQYFVDLRPKYDAELKPVSHGQWLRESHKRSKEAEKRAALRRGKVSKAGRSRW
jgi:phage terminase large subunit-like protein